MAHLPAPSRSSTCTILKEAISLFAKNPRVLSSLFLISLFAGYLLFSAMKFSTFSLHADVARISAALATTDHRSPAYSELLAALLRDTRELLSVELAYLVVGSAITYTLTAVNICALAAAQAGGKQQETLREVLRDAKPSLAGALLTQLLVAVLTFGYIFVVAMAVMTIYYLSDRSVWWLALAAALGVAAAAWWMYLMAIFSLSVVVSVVEQGTRGWKAISRAAELIKGSKWQGVGIVVVLFVVGVAVTLPLTAVTRRLHLGLWGQLCVGLGSVAVTKVASFVEWGAFVVLHSGCKRRHGEEAAVAGKLGYVSVPTADVES
ncbi:uncharacterized protein LOC141824691 [Curcuma longa]|uniref:uncharacterized protein LOC141824691 n=1 Tax=Curcuma longa TaxID=136217 RepID=UPI003D9F8E98